MTHMIQIITINDIPKYLRNSDLFRNTFDFDVSENDNEYLNEDFSFCIPCHFFKKNEKINSHREFFHLYRTCIYWGLDFPHSILNYIRSLTAKHFSKLREQMFLRQIESCDMLLFEKINKVYNYSSSEKVGQVFDTYRNIAKVDNLNCFKYIMENKLWFEDFYCEKIFDSPDFGRYIFDHKNMEAFYYLESIGYDFTKCDISFNDILEIKSSKDFLYVLNLFQIDIESLDMTEISKILLASDNVNLLKVFHEKGLEITQDMIQTSVSNNSLQCFTYLIKNNNEYDYCKLVEFLFKKQRLDYFDILFDTTHSNKKTFCETKIASNFSLNMFKHIFYKGCQLSKDGCELLNAAECSNLELMQFLVQKNVVIDKKVLNYSCMGLGTNKFDCIKYAVELGGSLTSECLFNLSKNCDLKSLKLIYDQLEKSHLSRHIFKYLEKDKIMENIVLQSKLDCVQYLLTKGFALTKTDLLASVKGTKPTKKLVKFIFEHVKEWHNDFMRFASKSNKLDIIKFAFANGCKLDSSINLNAAINKNIGMIIFSYKNNCPWHEETAWQAYKSNDEFLFDYVTDHTAPMSNNFNTLDMQTLMELA